MKRQVLRKRILLIAGMMISAVLAATAGDAIKSKPACTIEDIGTLGGQSSVANAINNNGQVVGYSQVLIAGHNHAFLWQEGQMIDLDTLGGIECHLQHRPSNTTSRA